MKKIDYFNGEVTKAITLKEFREKFNFTYEIDADKIIIVKDEGDYLVIDFKHCTRYYKNVHGTWLYSHSRNFIF